MYNKIILVVFAIFSLNFASRCMIGKSQSREEVEFELKIDSAFLQSFSTKGLKQLDPIKSVRYGEKESIYELLKRNAEYFEYAEFKVSEDIIGKVILTDFTISFDGEFKLIFLATYDLSGHLIDAIRLAKYELVSDTFYMETATVSNLHVIRQIYFEGFDDDFENVIKKKSTERYVIQKNGIIQKE